MNSTSDNSRRDFLTGKAARDSIQKTGEEIADAIVGDRNVPEGSSTLRLTQNAMACEFSVILNPGMHDIVPVASESLRLVEPLEDQMSVYRADSELSHLNALAAENPFPVEEKLYGLLKRSLEISTQTNGAFDPTTGPLLKHWSNCKANGRIPTQAEIDECLATVGVDHIRCDDGERTIEFDAPGVELNLGGIGKGFALDRIAEFLQTGDVNDFLLHGGYSSLVGAGNHNQTGGWPVGIGNPLFTDRRMGTLLLRNKAMSVSGSNIQYFRVDGKRYGHILDPRTGWPVENLLSVTVLADSAAQADALSTAFFVMGVENTRLCCDTLNGVGVIMMPFPQRGTKVTPTVIGIPEEDIFWDLDQVDPA